MAQTEAGRKKAVQTMKDRYGVGEDGKSLLHVKAGSKGGQASGNPKKGLGGVPRARRVELGKKGGKASGEARRTKRDE